MNHAEHQHLESGQRPSDGVARAQLSKLWFARLGHTESAKALTGGVCYCCLAEVRMYETIEQGKPATPYLAYGDTVRIEMLDKDGASIFGAIDQEVARYHRRSE